MASGLLVAGTGASLALAEPETGQSGTGSPQVGGSTSSPHEGGSTATKEPTTGAPATGTVAPGGAVTGSSGNTGAESKPTSEVGDGRNGLPAGHPTGTPVHGAATDPSKQSQHASGAPSQSGVAAPSEQTPGGTSSVAGDPRGIAVVDVPPGVEPPVAGPEPGPEPPTDGESAGIPDDRDALKDPNHPRGWHHPHDPNDPNHPYDPKDPKDPRGWHHPHDPNDPDHPHDPKDPDYPGEGHHPGFPWSWWKGCPPPGLPPGSGGSGGHGGANPEPPTFHPPKPPGMQLPIPREVVPDLEDISVPFFDAVAGLATAASDLPFEPLTLPVIVVPGGGTGAGGGAGGVGGPGAAPRPGMPSGPNPPASRGGSTEPPQSGKQQSLPAFSAGNQAMPPPSYRMGYGEYLRTAGLGEVAAVAIPGFTGILVLTGAGGLIGYRQARAGRSVRSGGTARFVS
jgi:hypothetical protein